VFGGMTLVILERFWTPLFMRVCFIHCLFGLYARLLEDIVGHCTWHAEAGV
jgi:hypothetical protein